jgi:hypothetical protein
MHRRVIPVLLTALVLVSCTPSAGSSDGSGGGNGSGSGGNNSSGNGSGGNTSGNGSGGNNSGSGSGGASGVACVGDTSNLVNPSGLVCVLDTPAKIQGSFYAYGDSMSCTVPTGAYNPCTGGMGCCISGTTTPFVAATNNWGCGLGMSLNTPPGANPTKAAYNGPVKCFSLEIAGSSGGNALRIGFKQSSKDSDIAPYIEIGAFKDGYKNEKICFADAMCPTWAATMGCTKATGDVGTPFDLQVQISAGDSAAAVGPYNICITKLAPILDSGSTGSGGSGGSSTCSNPSGQGTLTKQFDVGMVSCGSKQYIVQNNAWGSTAGQTVTFGTGTKFKVTDQKGTGSNGNPASFPSMFIGANSGHMTSDAPKAVTSIAKGSLPTSWTWQANGAGGEYNAAYDVWFSTSSGGEPQASSPSGGFLMVWLHKPTMNQPIGTMMSSTTIGGVNWNIWEGKNMSNQKPCITYQAQTPINSLSFNLGDFIRDAVDTQKFLDNSWYLTNVFAGYEIWSGGIGLETTDFSATMN